MNHPKITKLNYTYKDLKTGIWTLNTEDIPLPKESNVDKEIIYLAPKSIGGNHKHPRTEWFIGIGDLTLVWLDEAGNKQNEHMNSNDELLLVEIPPFVSHAVVNNSDTQSAILFEYADGKMKDEELVKIL